MARHICSTWPLVTAFIDSASRYAVDTWHGAKNLCLCSQRIGSCRHERKLFSMGTSFRKIALDIDQRPKGDLGLHCAVKAQSLSVENGDGLGSGCTLDSCVVSVGGRAEDDRKTVQAFHGLTW